MANKQNQATVQAADLTCLAALSVAGATTLTGATSLGLPLLLKSYATAGVPAAASYTGCVIYVTDGDSGSPCLAVSNGTDWLRIALGLAIAAV